MGQNRINPRRSRLRQLALLLFALVVAAPVLLLLLFRFVPPPGTPQMLWSLVEGKGANYAWPLKE